MSADERHITLIAGLVGTEHRQQFLTDVDFHATVQQFAALLPVFIAGLAAECARRHDDRPRAAIAHFDAARPEFPDTEKGDGR